MTYTPTNDPSFSTTNGVTTITTGQSVNVFAQSGDTGHVTDWTWNVVNGGAHTTADNSAFAISYRPVGSGVWGPTCADLGITVSIIKDNWLTSTVRGEVDGVTVITRQGIDDTAAFLANVGVVSGFGAVLEGVTNLFNSSGTILSGCDVQIAGIDSPTNLQSNPASYIGYCFTATAGTWTGMQLQPQSVAAAISVYINCLNSGGAAVFQVLSSGAVSSAGYYNGTGYEVSGTPVVGARKTGWTAGTGATPNTGAMNYGSATLAQLAARVMALEQALFATTGHGLIGP